MNYFNWTERMEADMIKKRGWFMSICFDKKNGEERILNGVLCFAKGQLIINEGLIDEPDFKAFNVNKIKWVRCEGITHRPKGSNSNGIKQPLQ